MDCVTIMLIRVIIWHVQQTEEFMNALQQVQRASCDFIEIEQALVAAMICFFLSNVGPKAAAAANLPELLLCSELDLFRLEERWFDRKWNLRRQNRGTGKAWLDVCSETTESKLWTLKLDSQMATFHQHLICSSLCRFRETTAQLVSGVATDVAIRVILWKLSWWYRSYDSQKIQEVAALICVFLGHVRPKAAPAILPEPSPADLWSQLDLNLLEEIRGRLTGPTDQARFRVVCTAWRAAARSTKATKSIPWKVKLDRSLASFGNKLEFRIYDPSSLSAFVHNIFWADLGIPSPSSFKNVGASRKNNWFFICVSKPRLFFWTRRYFLLYSPYTKKVITLPKLDFPSRFKFRRTFSADPDSPNCVFFLSETYDADKIVVITYFKSDTNWKAREFDRVQEFVPCDCIPIYFKGIFYLVSPFGQVASYNIVDDKFKFESLFIDEVFVQNYNSFRIYQVFELNGELMLIYFGSKKKNNDTLLGKQCIRMYDWSNKVWIPVRTLGDNAIFVGDHILSVAIVNTEESRNSRVLPNKIYRFYDLGCIIYSLEDGNLVEYRPTHSNLLEDGCGDLPEYKYNCGITSWDATKAFYWLEPPTVHY